MAKKEFEELVLEKLGSIEGDISGLKQDVSLLTDKVDKIDKRVSGIELKVDVLDIKATQMDYKISGLELKVAHVDKNIDGLYDENHSIQQAIATNGQYINQAFQRISEHLSRKV